MARIDLEVVDGRLERIIADLAILKDDAIAVMARPDRIDATAQSLVVEVCAMHSRHERLARRVERVGERAHPDRYGDAPRREGAGRRFAMSSVSLI